MIRLKSVDLPTLGRPMMATVRRATVFRLEKMVKRIVGIDWQC